MKKMIKKWLGIDKIEAQLFNNDKDILAIMDKQLRMADEYPLKYTEILEDKPKKLPFMGQGRKKK